MESSKLASFVNRCVVISFENVQEERACRRRSGAVSGNRFLSNNRSDETKWSCEELFEEFVLENDMCPWNSHLEESVRGLKLVGVLYPMTLLIGGREIYLNTVLTALGQRLLQAPLGYRILHFGEMTDIKIKMASPLPFIPLPDALCHIITVANRDSSHATLEYIMDQLFVIYHDDIQLPSEELVYQALGGLIKDKMLLHCGKGYRIIINDSYQPMTTRTARRSVGANKQRQTATVFCQTENVDCSTQLPDHTSPVSGHTDSDNRRRTLSPPGTNKAHQWRLFRSASEKSSDKDRHRNNTSRSDRGRSGSLLARLFGTHKKERQADKQQRASQHRTVSGQFPPEPGDVEPEETEDSICSQDGSSLSVHDLTPAQPHCAIHHPCSLQTAFLSQLSPFSHPSPELPSDGRYPTCKSSERRRYHRDQCVPSADTNHHDLDLDIENLYEPVPDFSHLDSSTAVEARPHTAKHVSSKSRRVHEGRVRQTNNAMAVTVRTASKHDSRQLNDRSVSGRVDGDKKSHHRHHRTRRSLPSIASDRVGPGHQHQETAMVHHQVHVHQKAVQQHQEVVQLHQENPGVDNAWLSSSQQTVIVESRLPVIKDWPTDDNVPDVVKGEGHAPFDTKAKSCQGRVGVRSSENPSVDTRDITADSNMAGNLHQSSTVDVMAVI